MKSTMLLKTEKLQMPILTRDLFFMVLLFIVFIPSSFDEAINNISLYAIIPFIFVFILIKNVDLFFKFPFFSLFILLFFWMLLSGVSAQNTTLYWAEIKIMVGCVMFCYILINLAWNNPRYVYYFYILYIIKFLFIFLYAYQHGLFFVNLNTERFGLEELNANKFGYFGFFAVVASFLLAEYTEKRQKFIFQSLFYICFLLVIIAGMLAASRATVLISVIVFSLFLIIKYLYPFSSRSVLPLILFILGIFLINYFFASTFNNSLLKSRFEVTEDSRYNLILNATEVGKEHWVFGVGSGNFITYSRSKQFSHSSYTELWANNGALGLILFILILVEFIRKIRKYVRFGGSKKIAGYFYVIWITYCVYNLFYVFYINFFLIGFFFLVRIHLGNLIAGISRRIKYQ